MDRTRVTVRCSSCSFEETYTSLRRARTDLATHRREHGHDVDWSIERLAPGVERAGSDAGVCGRPQCANGDSPLVATRPENAEDS
ncbi:hypothetical protein ACERIT_15055 [Halopenitus sp. H-Gu1]|uniref:DUF7542 family protein n=1 Tax=Halopenitus sp. H-Gu1 TaxID=3242697 RepID=UPI00359CBD25